MPLATGHTVSCTPNSGGVRRVAIALRGDVASVTTDVNGQVTAITMVSSAVFKPYENEAETVEFIENGSFENKSTLFEQSLAADWMGWGNADRLALLQLYQNSPCGLVIIHEEESGTAFIWGINPTAPTVDEKYYAKMQSSNRTTGKAFTDAAKTTYTLMARTTVPAAVFTPGWAGVPL